MLSKPSIPARAASMTLSYRLEPCQSSPLTISSVRLCLPATCLPLFSQPAIPQVRWAEP